MLLGIDIGGTGIKAGVLDTAGNLLKKISQPTRYSGGNTDLSSQLIEIIDEFRSGFTLEGIGIGSPGPLDVVNGIILSSANMPGIRNFHVIKEIREYLESNKIYIPVQLDNDANCAALGEMFYGEGKELTNFSVFTLGTGVGGGLILQRKLFRGYQGNGFEIGHIPIITPLILSNLGLNSLQIPRCGCGNTGCLETFSSATAVVYWYKYFANFPNANITSSDVAKMGIQNDKAALKAFTLASQALGYAAVTVTQLLNITDFIFTGGLAAASILLQENLEKIVRENVFSIFRDSIRITFATLDENAGIKGASALILE